MVLLHVKRGEESLFLFSCKVTDPVDSVLGKVLQVSDVRLLILLVYIDCQHIQRPEEGVEAG